MKLCTQLVHNTTPPPTLVEAPIISAEIELLTIYKEEVSFDGVNPELLARKPSMRRNIKSQRENITTAIIPNTINAE